MKPLGLIKIRPRVKSETHAPFPGLRLWRKNAKLRAMLHVLIFLVSLGARAIRAMCRRRAALMIEKLDLRQQVTALKKERPQPPLEDTDRAFWVGLRASGPGGRAITIRYAFEGGANALKALNEADEQRTSGPASNPFPDACTACPIVLGW